MKKTGIKTAHEIVRIYFAARKGGHSLFLRSRDGKVNRNLTGRSPEALKSVSENIDAIMRGDFIL